MVPVKPQVHPQKWLEFKEFSDWIFWFNIQKKNLQFSPQKHPKKISAKSSFQKVSEFSMISMACSKFSMENSPFSPWKIPSTCPSGAHPRCHLSCRGDPLQPRVGSRGKRHLCLAHLAGEPWEDGGKRPWDFDIEPIGDLWWFIEIYWWFIEIYWDWLGIYWDFFWNWIYWRLIGDLLKSMGIYWDNEWDDY